jgi:hypothetical protein
MSQRAVRRQRAKVAGHVTTAYATLRAELGVADYHLASHP